MMKNIIVFHKNPERWGKFDLILIRCQEVSGNVHIWSIEFSLNNRVPCVFSVN